MTSNIPLSYGLNNPLQTTFPAPIKAKRDPNSNDRNYPIGQLWLNTPSEKTWILNDVGSAGATWDLMASGASDLETLTASTGGAISPVGGTINIVGGSNVTTSGAGNTITIATTGVVSTLTGDTGGALNPTTGNINIVGGTGGLSVAGSGSTLTINGTADVRTLTGNTGGAISPDGSGNISITGTSPVLIGGSANALAVSVGSASTVAQGIVELATDAETIAGTDTTRANTPSTLKAKLGAQTAKGIPYGAGDSSAISWTSAMTNGQLIIGSTAGVPMPATLTSTGSSIVITNGSNSINLEASTALRTDAFEYALSDETTPLTTGVKLTFRAPYAATLTAVRASLTTASSSGTPTFDILQNGVSVLSTLITIDATEKTSTTAAIPPVISTSAITDDSEIQLQITVAGTNATGAKITLYLQR